MAGNLHNLVTLSFQTRYTRASFFSYKWKILEAKATSETVQALPKQLNQQLKLGCIWEWGAVVFKLCLLWSKNHSFGVKLKKKKKATNLPKPNYNVLLNTLAVGI